MGENQAGGSTYDTSLGGPLGDPMQQHWELTTPSKGNIFIILLLTLHKTALITT